MGLDGSDAQKWLLRLADGGGIAIYSMLADGSFALMNGDNGLALGNGGSDSWRFDTTIVSGQPYADANGAQRRLLDIAYSTPSPGANLCSAWISRVFNAAGYGYAYGDVCDMFWSYCHDSNRANLKVGMIIAVPSTPALGRALGGAILQSILVMAKLLRTLVELTFAGLMTGSITMEPRTRRFGVGIAISPFVSLDLG